MTRPENLAQPGDFLVEPVEISTPREGEVVFRACYLSIDPSARRRLPAADSGPGPLGQVARVGDIVLAGVVPPRKGLDGALVGEVVESRDPRFRPGDLVRGGNSWQTYHTVAGDLLDKLTPGPGFRLAAELGVLGRPGFVANCGLKFATGIEHAPRALANVLTGRNQGKQLIRI